MSPYIMSNRLALADRLYTAVAPAAAALALGDAELPIAI